MVRLVERRGTQLKELETRFGWVVRQRERHNTPLSHLMGGVNHPIEVTRVREHSKNSTQYTREALRLIDRYVTLQRQQKRPAVLPVAMQRELERLSVRQPLNLHPDLPAVLRKAVEVHHSRLIELFNKTEALVAKHGLTQLKANLAA